MSKLFRHIGPETDVPAGDVGLGSGYFAEEMLKTRGETIEGKVCTVSGSGNVAQYTVEKLIQLGAKSVTVSDSDGTIYDRDGMNAEKLAFVMELKNVRRGRIKEYADKFKAKYLPGKRPWHIPCQCAFPSATQNEISRDDAGGVATSGLEMSQNSMLLSWSREEVEHRLHQIMINIHKNCYETPREYGQPGNYLMGANIAGFIKVADAMIDQGLV